MCLCVNNIMWLSVWFAVDGHFLFCLYLRVRVLVFMCILFVYMYEFVVVCL